MPALVNELLQTILSGKAIGCIYGLVAFLQLTFITAGYLEVIKILLGAHSRLD